MMVAPFMSAGLPGMKKDLHPTTGPNQWFLWDKSLKTSAVPPKLTKIVRSAMCCHTSFLGNGGKARRCLLRNSVQPALGSPFSRVASAAITPPAALLEKFVLLTYLLHRFMFELGASVQQIQAFVNPD